MNTDNNFESLRDGVRNVVSPFDSCHWQETDEARSKLRRQSVAVTEPTTGSDSTHGSS